ncbi:Heat shock protein HslJ [Pedobacter westerhofensis]|uniref:Heat shock protein HslJ n=1 Tax=Pedobacter westerhofensis TaxID=425512 RepID=A0A521FU36_9SPHI|nr:META domain-containing protein [Pedobacter westerhofensis]SMO99622.1 Heat shock protein HslJ [Pedobacter westerhofensis]
MKFKTILFFLALTLFICACSTLQNTKTGNSLSNAIWELEYISGSRIAFDGLYPNKKPKITFNTKTNGVSGTSGCNGYSAKYTSNGKTISFGHPGPTTMMFCEGGGEQTFLKMIEKVDNYSIDSDGKLILNNGEVLIMRFKKSSK